VSWKLVRNRFLFREVNDRGFDLPLASVTRDGGVEFRSDLDISVWNPGDDVSHYKRVRPGDFVIGLRSFQSGIGSSQIEGLVSPAYTVLRPTSTLVEFGFFKHLFKSDTFVSRLENVAQGIRQGRTIATEDFYDIYVAVPPRSKQRAIADYLDAETTRIDALITKKRRMNELVQEQGEIQTEAALGVDGANADTWVPLRHLVSISGGLTLGKALLGTEVRRPYLRVANVQDGYLDLDEVTDIMVPTESAQRFELRVGDVLMLEGNGNPENLGRGTRWNGEIEGCLHQNHVHAVRSRGSIDSRYLDKIVRTAWARHQFTSGSEQVSIATLSQSSIKELRVPLPPLEEQVSRASEVAAIQSRVRRVASATSRQIDLLAERRQALITAAVTGELEIPGVAA
jgi:type I restriction enzyme S subunit